ncbi:hypothetical protein Val02_50060 [Virgisporangium aliadipatigenens]|uniref:Sporulation protein n=1 Tax=Virgisporangium aliadipatigenens TaxID=741659 RepID=A0A8J3YQF9_9ACTN|nr:sporulation protein [Virgisporangium aliadipatigenens]GIJ48120.1 hypothetical protein Val02_50060 [Virgisporangium aliadipatigenens]
MSEPTVLDEAWVDVARKMVGDAGGGAVFGPAVVRDDVTMVPVARVSVWSGGETADGGGERPASAARITARPLGALVVTHGKVCWRPALDVNKVILGGQVVAVVALLVAGAVLGSRRRCPGTG